MLKEVKDQKIDESVEKNINNSLKNRQQTQMWEKKRIRPSQNKISQQRTHNKEIGRASCRERVCMLV